MHVGIALFPTDRTSDIRDVARATEDAGFESLFVAEHTHIPVSRRTPYPAGGDLPDEYARLLDPFVALTAAACVTGRLRLGTGVCLVVEHDPILLAKEVASLDVISGGRVLFGVGAGWNHEEMADHGVDPSTRFSLMRERVLAAKALWTHDVASFSGDYVNFEDTWQWPKPVQQPHPPVLVGGSGPTAMRHAVEYGDGWLPMPDKAFGSMADRVRALKALAAEAGRPVPEVTAYAARPDREVLAHYESLGIARAVVMLPFSGDAVAAVRDVARQVL